jgi:hypothetical protein
MGRFILLNQNEQLCQRIQELAADFSLSEDIVLTLKPVTKGLEINYENGEAVISYHRQVELFRGLGFLKQWDSEGKTKKDYCETAVFSHLTYMADCSRNAVMNLTYIKKMIRYMALMGYDRFMLYTEDTFEVKEYPFFGAFRGRYSQAELTKIDDYASSYGIEMVPCIQTLAHLNAIFHWDAFTAVHDTGDILCCGLEQTYELLEAMIKSYHDSWRSRVINIGMDEAEMVGRGEFIKHFGYEERLVIMEKHVKRVVEICKKYGYTCMMWSDMYFKILSAGKYYGDEFQVSDEAKERIPQEVELIYWDYYSRNEEKYNQMMARHKLLSDNIAFAGGAWKWSGFAPLLNHSMLASGLALQACQENGIQNVIVTGWGDEGADCSQADVLPILSLYAEFCFAQNKSQEWVKCRLEACTGANLAAFLKLDCLNFTPDNPAPGQVGIAPLHYLLFQDPLLGFYDRYVDCEGAPRHFRSCYEQLLELSPKMGTFQYLFDTLASLSRVLEQKSVLGVSLKQAYDQKDRLKLFMIKEQCLELIQMVSDLQKKLRRQWLLENKIFGWEVQDIRFGALKERLFTCSERIGLFLAGEIAQIEELEEERLALNGDLSAHGTLAPVEVSDWKKIVTASVL